jgi:hypothetical protein
VAGRVSVATFVLPPDFVALTDRLEIWETVNQQFGTMLDIFEDEQISDSLVLFAIADLVGSVSVEGQPHLGELAQSLAQFLSASAEQEQCVEFWL